MEQIAQRAIVENHNLAKIRLHRTQVLDIRSLPICAVLTVVAGRKELALRLEPVNDGVRVLLDGCGEYNQVVPLADAPQKLVAVGSLVDPVQDGVLGHACVAAAAEAERRRVKTDLDHVAAVQPAAFGHAVNQCLVEIQNQSLLLLAGRLIINVGGLSAGNEWSGRRGGLGILGQGGVRRGGRLEMGGELLAVFARLRVRCCRLRLTMLLALEGSVVLVELDSYGASRLAAFVGGL